MEKLSTEQSTSESTLSKQGTTEFLTDDTTQTQVFNDKSYETGTLPIRDQGIADFLAKPQVLTTIDWASSQLPNTVLYQVRPQEILSTYPIFADKIKGFGLVRGTCVLRLVLNAEPFHAGKLITSFVPCDTEGTGAAWRLFCLNQKTQQPNVELDCRDAEAIIKIPYIAPTDYYDVKTGTIGWGQITVSVLSTLATGSGGPSVVNVTVFAHFEDFEMAAPMMPQSGTKGIKRYDRPKKAVSTSNSDKESSAMSNKSVSKALLMGSDVLSKVADIPMLSPLAQPASWVFRGLSGVASWFGWSKPLLDAPQSLVTRKFIPNMSNATGGCTTSNLGLYHDNAVEIMPYVSGSGIDEMSLDYLKHVKAYSHRFTMATTQSADTVLYTKFLGPLFLGEYGTINGTSYNNEYQSFNPGSYLANFFSLWRGGIKIHLRFAKTDYHSGRIMVTYTPGTDTTAPTTVGGATYSLREIIDVRSTSDVTLELPYLLNQAYIPTTDKMGTLNIIVLNELRAPTTVSQSVDVLVYYSFCGDYELAIPGIAPARSTGGQKPLAPMPFVPQYSPDEMKDGVIGGYVCPSFDMGPSRTCIGETFTSIKQLLNRYTTLWSYISNTTGDSFLSLYPFATAVITINTFNGDYLAPNVNGDALCNFACGYAFMRGGVKIIISQASNTNPGLYGASFLIDNTVQTLPIREVDDAHNVAKTSSAFYSTYQNMAPVQFHDPSPFHEISVPYYNKTHSSIVQCVEGDGYPSSLSQPTIRVAMGYPGATDYPINLARSCSDEFQLSYFIGFPPILISRGTA